ncbi:ABC transporter permease [Infirmifilum lucidum]|uniref:ABC transporter permease n=1 Tax=Infirmifilum lucidum TaxID=2776706 RepID=A0A7L9FIR4_9CREN|nr:ABC transporter permease [Infirmifilum lucidum]QOJ79728.1 ABC transporter permease [Infirmifilum lucidum]
MSDTTIGEILSISLLSLRVSVTAVALSSALGLVLGALVASREFRGRNVLVTVINTLMGTPPVLLGLLLYLLLSRSGPLGWMGILFTPEAMILAQFLLTLPITTGLTVTAVESLPRDVRELISSLRASRVYEALLLLNEARLNLIGAVLTALGRAVSEVGAVIIVGGNIRYQTRVLTTAIVYYTSAGEFDTAIALGAILAVIYLAVNTVIVLLKLRVSRSVA